MNSKRLLYVIAGILVISVTGIFGYKALCRHIVRDYMDPRMSHVRQLLLGIRQYVIDNQHSNQPEGLLFPKSLDSLTPDYLSQKDLKTLLTPPVEYIRPDTIPSDATVILVLRAERGIIEGHWNGDVHVILNKK